MNRTPILSLILGSVLSLVTLASAQVPQMINYQGRVAVGDPAVNFNGTGLFKFALVNEDGSASYWSNDDTSTEGSEPTAAVSLTVTKGLYSVLLGANMTRSRVAFLQTRKCICEFGLMMGAMAHSY